MKELVLSIKYNLNCSTKFNNHAVCLVVEKLLIDYSIHLFLLMTIFHILYSFVCYFPHQHCITCCFFLFSFDWLKPWFVISSWNLQIVWLKTLGIADIFLISLFVAALFYPRPHSAFCRLACSNNSESKSSIDKFCYHLSTDECNQDLIHLLCFFISILIVSPGYFRLSQPVFYLPVIL